MKKVLNFFIICAVALFAACNQTDSNNPENPDSGTNSGNPTDSVNDGNSEKLPVVEFSVSSTKKVLFAPGNLQYHLKNKQWRFAPNQFDYIGDKNINRTPSSSYVAWLDLFSWSTSATNFGVTMYPNSWDCKGDFIDWGRNKIGDDAPNTWRTLTKDEWEYIRYDRTNAIDLFGVARVNNVNGLILLPDNWSCPKGVTFKPAFHSDSWKDNKSYSIEEWSVLEASGAIFLPAAGVLCADMNHDDPYLEGQGGGFYWSSTAINRNDLSYYFCFWSGWGDIDSWYMKSGYSVRLVKDL